jgi:hypothetical protein
MSAVISISSPLTMTLNMQEKKIWVIKSKIEQRKHPQYINQTSIHYYNIKVKWSSISVSCTWHISCDIWHRKFSKNWETPACFELKPKQIVLTSSKYNSEKTSSNKLSGIWPLNIENTPGKHPFSEVKQSECKIICDLQESAHLNTKVRISYHSSGWTKKFSLPYFKATILLIGYHLCLYF